MSDSVYRKTPLPVKLNLNDRNTKVQLSAGAAEDTGRGALEGVGPATNAGAQSQKNCTDVMRKDLRSWLVAHEILGPPPSQEAEQRAMWQWIRDFHKEYSDDWFARNMPRVLQQFRPVFNDEMKRMKAEKQTAQAATKDAAPSGDLLDFDQPAPAAPAGAPRSQAQASGTADLLSLDATAPAPATTAPQQAPSAVYAAVDPLLAPVSEASPLDVLGPASVSAPLAGAGSGASGGLLDLVLDAPSAGASMAATAPPSTAPVTQATPTKAAKDPLDLLDLM